MCLMELMLIKSIFCASILFVITGTFFGYILGFSQKYFLVFVMKIIIMITIKSFWKMFHVNIINMPYYGRISVSKGVDVNLKSTCRERVICY